MELARSARWRRRRGRLLPYALIAPIALLLLAISVYPSLYAIWLAMTDASLLRLARAQFIGFGNFVRHGGDTIFLDGAVAHAALGRRGGVHSSSRSRCRSRCSSTSAFRGRGFVRVGDDGALHHAAGRGRRCCSATCSTAISAWSTTCWCALGVLDRYVVVAERPDRQASGVTVAAMVWYGTAADGADPARVAADHPGPSSTRPRTSTARARGAASGYITLPHLMPSILFLVLLRTIWMSNHIDMIFVHDAGRPRLQPTTPRRSTASSSPTSSRSATPRRSPWCWRSSWSRPRRSTCATSRARC